MLKRSVFALAIGASLLIGGLAQARDTGLVGVITSVEPNRLELRTDRGQETASVTLSAETTYLKWLMAKPWQQDLRTDSRSLRVGRRVHIDVTPGARPVAQTVWIVTGRPGLD
jgi:hypothetical protein